MDPAAQKAVFEAVMDGQQVDASREYKAIEDFDRLVLLSHYLHEAGVPVRIQVMQAHMPWKGNTRLVSGLSFEGEPVCLRGYRGWNTIMDEAVKTYDPQHRHERPAQYDFEKEFEEDYGDYALDHPHRLQSYQEAQAFVSTLVAKSVAEVKAKNLEQATPIPSSHSRRPQL